MARDLSRFRIPQRNQPDFEDQYAENDYLPPEVERYLRMLRRRPYVIRGIIAGALIALGGVWLILETRRSKQPPTKALENLPVAM